MSVDIYLNLALTSSKSYINSFYDPYVDSNNVLKHLDLKAEKLNSNVNLELVIACGRKKSHHIACNLFFSGEVKFMFCFSSV